MHGLYSKAAAALVAVAFFAIAFTGPTQAVYTPAAGTSVTASTSDFVPSLDAATLANACLARWDRGTANVIEDDIFYIHWDTSGTCNTAAPTVSAGDIRLAVAATGGVSGLAAMAVVKNGDSDVNQVLIDPNRGALPLPALGAHLEWLEKDGIQGLSPGDIIFIDWGGGYLGAECPSEADGFGHCDLRLNSYTVGSAFAAGTMVKTGDADVAEAGDLDGVLPDTTSSTAFTAEALWYFDANENNQLDAGTPLDTLYLRLDGAPASQAGPANHVAQIPVAMDLRLTAFGALAAGTLVAAGDADHKPTLETAPAAKLVCYPAATCSTAGAATDKLVFAFKAAPTHVSYGDLAMNTVTGQTAGAFVSTTADGLGQAVVASASTALNSLYYIDLSPSGFGPEDPVYLNRPTDIGGVADAAGFRLSERDVRVYVPSGSSFSAGSVVAAGNADLVAYNGVAGIGLTDLKHFDADRGQPGGALRALAVNSVRISGGDGAWAAGEMVYIAAAGAAITSPVAAGQMRVTPVTYGEGSAVSCGPDADCGSPVTITTDIRITGGDGAYAAGEDAYISSDNDISDGDVRLTPTANGAVGSSVVCSSSPGECGVGVLTAATTQCLSGGDATWSTGEVAYTGAGCAGGMVVNTMSRITPINLAGATAVVSTDIDIGLATSAVVDGSIKLTGADNIYTAGTDHVYVSADSVISAGDTRLSDITLNSFTSTSGTAVAAAHPDVPGSDAGVGDSLYLSDVGIGAAHLPLMFDVRVAAYKTHAFGTSVREGNADFTPRLVSFTTAATDTGPFLLGRADYGTPNIFTDDGYYAIQDVAAPYTPSVGDVRLTHVAPFSKAPGTLVQSGDGDTSTTLTSNAIGLFDSDNTFFHYIDGPNSKVAGAYDSGDLLYLDNDQPTAADNALGNQDIRLKSVTVGAATYSAGTIVQTGDTDRISYQGGTFASSPGAGLAFRGKFIDVDGDAVFDPGEAVVLSADSADCSTTACSSVMRLGDVFLSGTGGTSTSSTSAPPVATTATTPPTTTTPTPTPSTTTPTPTTTPISPAQQKLILANAGLDSSLKVTRTGSDNHLTWDVQSGAAGYQVWHSASPFTHIADVTDPAQGHYTHVNGPATGTYVVTAWVMDGSGTLGKFTDLDNVALPGNEDKSGVTVPEAVPTGSTAPTASPTASQEPSDEPVPGVGLVTMLGLLALALVAARRRL